MKFKPSYINLYNSGDLENRINSLFKILESCELCPRNCHINRLAGEKGYCKMGNEIVVSSFGPHFGEEKELVGIYGSGTIFLAGCSLLCVYCQNFETSKYRIGKIASIEKVAQFMLALQRAGCHNINLVTPTHFTPQLIKSIEVGIKQGLRIPIVWNCSGYENIEVVKFLDGIVDIYLPDIKYGTLAPAKEYSDAPDYFDKCKLAISEMYRQVGNLKINKQGIAIKGLMVRHLVLPNNQSGSKEVLTFVRGLSENIYVNIMDQYRPAGRAYQYNKIKRRITSSEYDKIIQIAKDLGLKKIIFNNF